MDGPRVSPTDASSAAMGAAPFVTEEGEAIRALRGEAQRHASGVPPVWLADQAVRVTAGTDFAVTRDALDALVRRALAVKRDELVIARRPARRAVRGAYRVGRRGGAERRYDVWLETIEPPAGSCSCPDYAKAGLGLCKHLLRVLGEAAKAKAKVPAVAEPADGPVLCWDPVRPFTGAGDWLERVYVRSGRSRGRASAADRLFATAGPIRRLLLLRADDTARRRHVVETLQRWIAARGPGFAEPAIAPLLRDEHQRLVRIDAAIPARELAGHLAGLKRTLFPYQREGVRRFLSQGRLLLADDMGLGKTAQAIAACHALFAAGRVTRGLIVVPASLKAQWAREWAAFTDQPITIVDGNADERARLYRRRAGTLLVNYEQVLRDLPLMLRYAPEVVVLDEAQRIKNWAAKTSAFVKRLDAPWRLVLTGTPMENRLEELSSVLEWVDETALEPRWRLGAWHAVRGDGRREVVGARNLETLRTRLRPIMLRRLRTEVLHQLPSRCDTWVPVPLTGEQQAAHDELNQPIAQLAAIARSRPLTQPQFLRLMSFLTQQRIICNGLAQRDFAEVWPTLLHDRPVTSSALAALAMPKLAELRERVAAIAIDQGRKIVVFSQWRRMLKLAAWAVKDVLGEAGVRAVFFTGEESQRRRTENLVAFHDDPAVRILFATDAGGVGLNLQSAASCCINLDLPWNPAVLEQRVGRVHRFGQTRPVEVYALVADGGIEARIAGLVDDKKALFRGLFDGTSDAVEFAQAGSFLSRIERLIERPIAPPDEGDGAAELSADPDGIEPTDEGPESDPELGPEIDPLPATAAMNPTVASVTELMGQVVVRALPDGRVSLDAPPEAAAMMASMLRAFASMLDAKASPG